MAEYFLTVRTPDNKKIGYITESYKLEYFRNEGGYGSLYVTLPQDKYGSVNFEIDGRLEIWRNSASAGPSLEGETQWLIRLIRNKIDEQGRKILHILAYDAVQLLDRRIVAYVAGESQSFKVAMPADDLMKAIVRENMGALATDTDRDLSDYFVVEDDSSMAPEITMEDFAFRKIMPLLTAICEKSSAEGTYLTYDVTYSAGQQKLVFRTYTGQRGVNRGKSSQNRLVFASTTDKFPVLGTGLSYASIEIDATDERTYVYSGGRAEDKNEFYTEAYDMERINASPFGRYEDFIDAEDTATINTLAAEAYAWLQHKQRRTGINGHIEQLAGLVYGRDYGFGDIVAFQYLGRIYDVHLDEIHVVVDDQNREDIRLFTREDDVDFSAMAVPAAHVVRMTFDPYSLIGSTYELPRSTNRYLVFACGSESNASYKYFTSISVNGSPMTKLLEPTFTTRAQIWGLVIPDAWAGTVPVTYVTAGQRPRIEKHLFDGVDPVNPILASGTDGDGSSADTASSITIQADADGFVLDVFSSWGSGIVPVQGAGQTLDTGRGSRGASYYTTPIDGNVTMQWTFAASRNAHAAISLKPV